MRSKEASLKNELKDLINEYWLTLQNGWFDSDMQYIHHLDTDNLHEKMSYELPKLYSWLYSEHYDPHLDYYFEKLNGIDQWNYDFSKYDTSEITLLKLLLLDKELIN